MFKKMADAAKGMVQAVKERLASVTKWMAEKFDAAYETVKQNAIAFVKSKFNVDHDIWKSLEAYCQENGVKSKKAGFKIQFTKKQLVARTAVDKWQKPYDKMFTVSENMKKSIPSIEDKIFKNFKTHLENHQFMTAEFDDKGILFSVNGKPRQEPISKKEKEIEDKIKKDPGVLASLKAMMLSPSNPEVDGLFKSILKTLRSNSFSITLAAFSCWIAPPAGAFAIGKLIVTVVLPVLFDFGIAFYGSRTPPDKQCVQDLQSMKKLVADVMKIINMFHATYKAGEWGAGKIIDHANKQLADNLERIKDGALTGQIKGILDRGLDSSKNLTPSEANAIGKIMQDELSSNPPGGPLSDAIDMWPAGQPLPPALSAGLVEKLQSEAGTSALTNFESFQKAMSQLQPDDQQKILKHLEGTGTDMGEIAASRFEYMKSGDITDLTNDADKHAAEVDDMFKQAKAAGLTGQGDEVTRSANMIGGKIVDPVTGPTEYQKDIQTIGDSMKSTAAGKAAANKLMAAGKPDLPDLNALQHKVDIAKNGRTKSFALQALDRAKRKIAIANKQFGNFDNADF